MVQFRTNSNRPLYDRHPSLSGVVCRNFAASSLSSFRDSFTFRASIRIKFPWASSTWAHTNHPCSWLWRWLHCSIYFQNRYDCDRKNTPSRHGMRRSHPVDDNTYPWNLPIMIGKKKMKLETVSSIITFWTVDRVSLWVNDMEFIFLIEC